MRNINTSISFRVYFCPLRLFERSEKLLSLKYHQSKRLALNCELATFILNIQNHRVYMFVYLLEHWLYWTEINSRNVLDRWWNGEWNLSILWVELSFWTWQFFRCARIILPLIPYNLVDMCKYSRPSLYKHGSEVVKYIYIMEKDVCLP